MAGVGSFLVFYAISRTSPAIVDAVNGLRYVIIFLGTWLLTRFRPAWLMEEFRGWPLLTKAIATLLVIAGLVIVGVNGSTARQNGQSSDKSVGAPHAVMAGRPHPPERIKVKPDNNLAAVF
jgi:hypothetical protein